MGIPHFYRWLRNKGYTGVLRRSVPRYVSSFSLDANGIIHQCAQLVYAYGEHNDPRRRKLIAKADPRMLEAEFYNAVSSKLQEIVSQVMPQEILVIAIDGVAPMGKITQQRQRRFRSALERDDNSGFDSNCITPGTDFMIRLDNFIQRWIISYQATLPPKVIYSSHMVPNEGEHKIMDLMRSGDIKGEGAHVLYGMDADLIMLSLISPVDRISLMREDIRDVIHIDTLKEALLTELENPTAIRDFVVMIFTIGNDFLPHMPALENLSEAITTLTDVYKQTGMSLTTDDDLDWAGLTAFLTNLAKEEPRLLQAEATRDVKFPSRMLVAASKRTEKIQESDVMTIGQKITFETEFDYNIFRGAWYQNSLVPKGSDVQMVKGLIPGYNFGVTMDKVVTMCQRYLVGMAWVYSYYTKGTIAINADFVYRYHHTPMMSDIASVLSQVKTVDGYKAHPDQVVLNPIHQLLSVLPLKSKNLLPKEVTHLMTKDSQIADLYPETAVIEMDGKNAAWQGVVLIPFVDPARVIMAVNTTTMFTAERAKLYSQGNNIVIIRDAEMDIFNKKNRGFRQFLDREKTKGRGGRGRGGQNRGYQGGNRGGDRGGGQNRGYQGGNKGGGDRGGGQNRGYQNKGYQGGNRGGGRGYQNKGYQGGNRGGGRGYQNKGGNRGNNSGGGRGYNNRGYQNSGGGRGYNNRNSPRGRSRSPGRPNTYVPQNTIPQVQGTIQTGLPPTGIPSTNIPATGMPQTNYQPNYQSKLSQTFGKKDTQTSSWKKRTTIL